MRKQAAYAVLIAPCGMNCGLCHAFLRARNRCPGCRSNDRGKPKTRAACCIKTCGPRGQAGQNFCSSSSCASFPCERLARLDKRYRTKYGMSMLANLKRITSHGWRHFVEQERARWACPECSATLCVHKASCLSCHHTWR